MKSLIVGYGEIGKAVRSVIEVTDEVFIYDPNLLDPELPDKIDVLHVCFPPSETFVKDVQEYGMKFNPDYVLIWSSVAIGTCKDIGLMVAHTPVEGKHPRLADSIKQTPRWVGCNTTGESDFYYKYFGEMGVEARIVGDTDWTEALKLLSTSEYGINIVFAAYKKKIADALEMDYELMQEWNSDYNALYKALGMDLKYQKYVLDAPEGKIGGHCVVPNAEILNEQYPHEMLKMIRDLK